MRAIWSRAIALIAAGVAACFPGATAASADVVRIEITRRDNIGQYERVVGRVYFAIDPANPANRAIADLPLAPTGAGGLVESRCRLRTGRRRPLARPLHHVAARTV